MKVMPKILLGKTFLSTLYYSGCPRTHCSEGNSTSLLFVVVVSLHQYQFLILLFVYSLLNQKKVTVGQMLPDQRNEWIFLCSH